MTLSDFLLLTDGYEENAPDVSCFFSETDEGGWAEINLISWSFVNHVRILGQSLNGWYILIPLQTFTLVKNCFQMFS